MDAFFKTLDNAEALVTKLVTWVIYVPKTLLWIIFHPGDVPGYIHGELNPQDKKEENKSTAPHLPFAGYVPPVILLLIVALIPALFFSFVRPTGTTISQPVPESSTSEEGAENVKSSASTDTYKVTANFAVPVGDAKYHFTWWVEDARSITEIPDSRQDHDVQDGSGKTITQVDAYTVEDTYSYQFTEPGDYYINVRVWRFSPRAPEYELVSYYDYVRVTVSPQGDNGLRGAIHESSLKLSRNTKTDIKNLTLDNFSARLKNDSIPFLALGLLLPPLLFAFVSHIVTRKEINEKSVRETFYAECYYFAPLSLAIWTFYYSLKFFTNDVSLYALGSWIIYVPLLSALVWFVIVETTAIADENKEDNITWPRALLIVASCMIVLFLAASFLFALRSDFRAQDILRVNLIRLYILAGLFLLARYFWNRRAGKSQTASTATSEPQKPKSRPPLRRIIMWVSVSIVGMCFLFFVLILWLGSQPITATPPIDATLTASSSADASEPEAEVNYTEEMIGKIDNWGPVFMTSGEESQANLSIEDGGLHFQLSEKQDQIPQAYFINNSSTYTDVQVEAIVKNNGNPENGVSLICRFDESNGWYEFEFSNSGSYTIYAFDAKEFTYVTLASGQSGEIQQGLSENKYTIACKGNELSLLANDKLVDKISETKFNFTQGKIGISLYSPTGRPVDVTFESVQVGGLSVEQTGLDTAATPVPVVEVSVNNTPVPEVQATPTEAVPQAQEFHTEEFGSDFVADNWEAFTKGQGNSSDLVIQQEDDHLLFDLGDEDLYVYYMYTLHEYDDVSIKLNAENLGRNNNNVSLVCRMNADRTEWYEFSVENGGVWYLYAVRDGIYNVIGDGGTLALKQGQEINEYAMTCNSNQITLYVNDDNLITVTDNTFKYESGLVGINISSLNVLPITVNVNWFEISQP